MCTIYHGAYDGRMLITVRVAAGKKRESVSEISPGRFSVSVREEAEQNAANRRLLALVALRFGVPVSQVRIVKGHRSPSKTLSIGPRVS